MNRKHIAVVILNYNSEKDLQICAEQMAQQVGVHLSLILVDNASQPASLAAIRSWLADWNADALCGTVDEIEAWVSRNPGRINEKGGVYLVENNVNRGYSTGNNTGFRLAEKLGADAGLIINPDVRVTDPSYIKALAEVLYAEESNCIVASRILGIDGENQNPVRESTFWEEFLWPVSSFSKRMKRQNSYILSVDSGAPVPVPKVSGCCLMMKMSFLQAVDYLDENIFLYCEEPILSAKVKTCDGRIIYVPGRTAHHMHKKREKGDASLRMLQFITSRKYYLKNYSGYNFIERALLYSSYMALYIMHKVRAFICKSEYSSCSANFKIR